MLYLDSSIEWVISLKHQSKSSLLRARFGFTEPKASLAIRKQNLKKKVLSIQYLFCKIYPTIVCTEKDIDIKKLQKNQPTKKQTTKEEKREMHI